MYKTSDVNDINFRQAQAVCFTEDGQVVLYEHKDGWYGLPGGHIEAGEDIEAALRREIREETAAELKNHDVLGYEKVYPEGHPVNSSYFLRCRAIVKLLDEPISDPNDKVVRRVVLSLAKAQDKIGYGKRGQFWLRTARALRL